MPIGIPNYGILSFLREGTFPFDPYEMRVIYKYCSLETTQIPSQIPTSMDPNPTFPFPFIYHPST